MSRFSRLTIAALAALHLGDLITTWVGLQNPAVEEVGTLASHFYYRSGFAALVAAQTLLYVPAVAFAAWRPVGRRSPLVRLACRALALWLVSVKGYAVVNNIGVITSV